MSDKERHKNLQEIADRVAVSVRQKHFSVGAPVVYGREGEVFYEFPDGSIVRMSIKDVIFALVEAHPSGIDCLGIASALNLRLQPCIYLLKELVQDGRIEQVELGLEEGASEGEPTEGACSSSDELL
jgi:hypothetical protein